MDKITGTQEGLCLPSALMPLHFPGELMFGIIQVRQQWCSKSALVPFSSLKLNTNMDSEIYVTTYTLDYPALHSKMHKLTK